MEISNWQNLTREDLEDLRKVNPERLREKISLIVAQNDTIKINQMKAKIDDSQLSIIQIPMKDYMLMLV